MIALSFDCASSLAVAFHHLCWARAAGVVHSSFQLSIHFISSYMMFFIVILWVTRLVSRSTLSLISAVERDTSTRSSIMPGVKTCAKGLDSSMLTCFVLFFMFAFHWRTLHASHLQNSTNMEKSGLESNLSFVFYLLLWTYIFLSQISKMFFSVLYLWSTSKGDHSCF